MGNKKTSAKQTEISPLLGPKSPFHSLSTPSSPATPSSTFLASISAATPTSINRDDTRLTITGSPQRIMPPFVPTSHWDTVWRILGWSQRSIRGGISLFTIPVAPLYAINPKDGENNPNLIWWYAFATLWVAPPFLFLYAALRHRRNAKQGKLRPAPFSYDGQIINFLQALCLGVMSPSFGSKNFYIIKLAWTVFWTSFGKLGFKKTWGLVNRANNLTTDSYFVKLIASACKISSEKIIQVFKYLARLASFFADQGNAAGSSQSLLHAMWICNNDINTAELTNTGSLAIHLSALVLAGFSFAGNRLQGSQKSSLSGLGTAARTALVLMTSLSQYFRYAVNFMVIARSLSAIEKSTESEFGNTEMIMYWILAVLLALTDATNAAYIIHLMKELFFDYPSETPAIKHSLQEPRGGEKSYRDPLGGFWVTKGNKPTSTVTIKEIFDADVETTQAQKIILDVADEKHIIQAQETAPDDVFSSDNTASKRPSL